MLLLFLYEIRKMKIESEIVSIRQDV